MKLKQKIQVLIIFISAVIYLFAIGYISINARQSTYQDTKSIIDNQGAKFANKIQGKMDENMAVVRTLALSFSNYDHLPKDQMMDFVNKMYEDVFPAYPNFYNLWDSWELKAIDTSWEKSHGRIVNQRFRDQGIIKSAQTIRSKEGDNEIYTNIKTSNREMVLDLYFDVFTEGKSEKKLMTSLLAPIQNEQEEYVGAVAVDITMDEFQELIKDISMNKLEGSYSFLLSHNGKYAGHPDTSLLNEKAPKNPTDKEDFDLFDKIDKGEPFSIVHKENEYNKQYVSYNPIEIGRTGTPWFLGLSVPVSSIMEEADRNFIISLIVGFVGLIILSLVIYLITKSITKSVTQVTNTLKKLAQGQIDKNMKLEIQTGDELEEMADALNTTIDGFSKKNVFAKHLRNGYLDCELSLLSNNDELGKSLLEMRDSLKKAKEEEEKRKQEEAKRQWVNEGINQFADILRQNNDDLQKLADEIIKKLVHYLEANQGGIFLIEEEEEENNNKEKKKDNKKHLELLSAFAFDRKKYFEKKIDIGDGLVGTCALEQNTIYLTEVPQDYIEITSGLGDANPNCLLIVPLKVEDETLGVIEIASFKELEQYQIEFVEKVSHNIASTISTSKVNMKTQKLLEQSNQQAEELSSQEEEMRQNMEELKATQEEAAKQKAEMESLVNAFHKANYLVEYDTDEKIIDINDKYLNLLGLTRDEVMGTHHSYKMKMTEKQKENYKQFWDDLRKGKVKKETNTVELKGKTYTFAETYTPITDEENNVVKILKIAIETSEFGL
ncbi:MAG: GAF domain-containing protein [Bacteroidota bacterium]